MRKEKTCKKLQKRILPKGSIYLWVTLAITFLLPLLGYLTDKQYISIKVYKKICTCQNLDRIRNYLFTFSTITAAVLVLYYTIQDNQREGIPHRKVVGYIFGSRALPILLFCENMGMMFIVFSKKDTTSLYAGVLFSVIILQNFIVFIVIFSSSSFFCQCSIKYTESKQFKCLMKYRLKDRKYIWNYLIQHMSQVIAGDDMIFDKVYLVRQLLDIPDNYWDKYIDKKKLSMSDKIIFKIAEEVSLKSHNQVFQKFGQIIKLSELKSYQMWEREARRKWRELAYEYYFLNILMTMEQLKDKQESINQIFLTLYGFLEKHEKTYQRLRTKNKLDYLVVHQFTTFYKNKNTNPSFHSII